MDLRAVWGSGKRMVDEFESALGRLEAEEAFNLALIFTLAAKQAKEHQLQVVKTVVMDRQSCQPSQPTLSLQANDAASSSGRRVIRTGFAGPVPVLASCAQRDPQCREEMVKQTKLEALFAVLLEDFLDLRELGVDHKVLEDPLQLQSLQTSVMKGASRLGVQRLGALTSSLKRWKKWATQHEVPLKSPGAMQVAEFLKEVNRGGPTAAASMFHVLKWYEDSMGLDFCTSHFLVKPFRMHEAHHTGTQAVELSPSEFINLLQMVRTAQGSYMMVLTFMIQSAVSCIRFEHMQRSRMIASYDGYIEFDCRQGKARRKGARPAYRWATPEVEFQGWSLCSTLRDFYGHECLPGATFLWPALQLSATELWELTDVTPFDASKPMSRSRFLELLRGAIGEMGAPQEDAASAGYNRLRRFLPTLGNCLRLPRTEMQALGSWVEIPSGGGPQPSKKEKAVMDMGYHYAGQKVVRSAQIKSAILRRFFRLYRIKAPELALSGTGHMKFDAWTWPELCSMGNVLDLPQFEVPAAEMEVPMPVEDEQPPVIPVRHVDPVDSSDSEDVGQEQIEKVASSGSDDEDSSSSASDVSAVAEELEGVMHEDSFHANMKWLQQGKKIHVVKAVPHEGRQIPWCRDFPFAQEPVREGEGFEQVSKEEFCQRCLARLPRAICTALAEHCAWMH